MPVRNEGIACAYGIGSMPLVSSERLLKRFYGRQDAAREQHRAEVRARNGISKVEEEIIIYEGLNKDWPLE